MTDGEAKRRSKGMQQPLILVAPAVQQTCAKRFNGVDKSDKDTAKCSCSFRSNRWHLCIVCWMVDKVVHGCFIICTWLASDTFFPEWKVHQNKNGGRKKFQVDLGIALMNKGIEMDWEDGFDESKKPKWMPKTRTKAKCHPCDCKKCFFCLNGKTTTVTHGPKTALPPTHQCSENYVQVSRKCCIVCKRNAKAGHPGMKWRELVKLKKMEFVRKGCLECNRVHGGVAVCEKHWSKHTHKPGDHHKP